MLDDLSEELGPYDDMAPADGARKALAVVSGSGTDDDRGEAAIFLGSILDLVDENETFDFGIPLELGQEIRTVLWGIHDDLQNSEIVRRRCLEALVRWPVDPVPAVVRTALDTPGPWRVTGLFCAGFVSGFEDDVRRALHEGTLEEKVEAWRAAANLELQDVGPHAIAVARDPAAPQEERFEAIGALAWIGESAAATIALDEIASGDDEELAEAATEAMSLRNNTETEMWDVTGADDEDEDEE